MKFEKGETFTCYNQHHLSVAGGTWIKVGRWFMVDIKNGGDSAPAGIRNFFVPAMQCNVKN
jgi:hypothetical protein